MGKMNNTRQMVRQWCDDVVEYGVKEDEKRLVKHLSFLILNNWKVKANQAAVANGTDWVTEFSQMYLHNKEKAQGAIVAIIELVRSVGNCDNQDRRLNLWKHTKYWQ